MATRRGQGEGAVYQRHGDDCRLQRGAKTCACAWVAAMDYGFIGGKRVRRVRVARRNDGKRPTKTDAVRMLEVLRQEKDAGVISNAAPLSQWLTYWLDNVVDPSKLKASTKVYYRSYVEQWLIPMMGTVRLDRLGPEHVRGLHKAMRDAGKSPTTIRNAHATLRKALAVALAERRVRYNWAREVTAPDAADNPHEQLTVDEAGNVFVVACRDPRELARVHVAILCGLRQGEALGLRWDDVDLVRRRVIIRQQVVQVNRRGE